MKRFAAFEQGDYDGTTYLDTFFLKTSHVANEGLYFHELIHVVQWRVLGPERFLAAYADGLETFGYRNSPLEAMAYDAQAAFAQSTQIFDANRVASKPKATPDLMLNQSAPLKKSRLFRQHRPKADIEMVPRKEKRLQ